MVTSSSFSGPEYHRSTLFAEQVLPHLEWMQGLALAYAKQEADGEEILQEALLRTWRTINPARQSELIQQWLEMDRCAHNRFLFFTKNEFKKGGLWRQIMTPCWRGYSLLLHPATSWPFLGQLKGLLN